MRCPRAFWFGSASRLAGLLALVGLLLVVGVGEVLAQAQENNYSWPYFGPDGSRQQMLHGAFLAQSGLFGAREGYGDSSFTALQVLAMLAALVGAIAIAFRRKLWSLPTIAAWLLLVIIVVFVPINARLLFMPLNDMRGPLLQAGSREEFSSTYYGFTPQLAAIDLASRAQVIVSDMFRSFGWRDLVEEVVANERLLADHRLVLNTVFLQRVAEYNRSCGLPLAELYNEDQPTDAPGGPAGTPEAPRPTTVPYRNLGTLWLQLLEAYSSTGAGRSPPPIGILFDEQHADSLEAGFDRRLYAQGIEELFHEVTERTETSVEWNGEGENIISVGEALTILKNAPYYFFRVESDSNPGPGFFLQPLSDYEADVAQYNSGRGFAGMGNSPISRRTCFFRVSTETDQTQLCEATNIREQSRNFFGVYAQAVAADEYRAFIENSRLSETARQYYNTLLPRDQGGRPITLSQNWQAFVKSYPSLMNIPIGVGHVRMDSAAPTANGNTPASNANTRLVSRVVHASNNCRESGQLLIDDALGILPAREYAPLRQLLRYSADPLPPHPLPREAVVTEVSVMDEWNSTGDFLHTLMNRTLRNIQEANVARQADGRPPIPPEIQRMMLLAEYMRVVITVTQRHARNTELTAAERAAVEDATDVRVVGSDALTTVGGGLATMLGAVLIKVGEIFTGPVAQAFVTFVNLLVQMVIMSVIVLTPFLLLAGVLMPGAAAGVLVISVLAAFIMQFVPVTMIILNFLGGLIYDMIGAVDADASWVMASMLVIAMSTLYTTLVGLTLFLIFKIGDPVSTLSGLGQLDKAAKQAADYGMKATIAAAGIAAALAGGFLSGGARGVWNKVKRGDRTGIAQGIEDRLGGDEGPGGGGRGGGEGRLNPPPAAVSDGPIPGGDGPGGGAVDNVGPSSAANQVFMPQDVLDAMRKNGMSENDLRNIQAQITDAGEREGRVYGLYDDDQGRRQGYELKMNNGKIVGATLVDDQYQRMEGEVPFFPPVQDSAPQGENEQQQQEGNVAEAGDPTRGQNENVVAGNLQGAGVGSGTATGQTTAQTRTSSNASSSSAQQQPQRPNIDEQRRQMEAEQARIAARASMPVGASDDIRAAVADVEDAKQLESKVASRIKEDNYVAWASNQLNAFRAMRSKLLNGRAEDKLTDDERKQLKEYDTRIEELLSFDAGAARLGDVHAFMEAFDRQKLQLENFRSGADKEPGFLMSGFSGVVGATKAMTGGAGSIPILGDFVKEVANEWTEAPERARAWQAAGGFWSHFGKRGDAESLKAYQSEIASIVPGEQYREMVRVGGFQAVVDTQRFQMAQQVAKLRSEYEQLISSEFMRGTVDLGAIQAGNVNLRAQDFQLQGLGRVQAAQAIGSVHAEAAAMQGESWTVKVFDPNEGKLVDRKFKPTAYALSRIYGDLGVKQAGKYFDAAMTDYYGVVEKMYERGEAKWDLTRGMARDRKIAAHFMATDIDADYLVAGHLKMVQGKEQFMGLQGAYEQLVQFRNTENGDIMRQWLERPEQVLKYMNDKAVNGKYQGIDVAAFEQKLMPYKNFKLSANDNSAMRQQYNEHAKGVTQVMQQMGSKAFSSMKKAAMESLGGAEKMPLSGLFVNAKQSGKFGMMEKSLKASTNIATEQERMATMIAKNNKAMLEAKAKNVPDVFKKAVRVRDRDTGASLATESTFEELTLFVQDLLKDKNGFDTNRVMDMFAQLASDKSISDEDRRAMFNLVQGADNNGKITIGHQFSKKAEGLLLQAVESVAPSLRDSVMQAFNGLAQLENANGERYSEFKGMTYDVHSNEWLSESDPNVRPHAANNNNPVKMKKVS